MHRALATLGVAGALVLAPISVGTAAADVAPVAAPVLAQDVDDDGDGETGRWGLAGLAGMLGLFGYRKYTDSRSHSGPHDSSRRL